MSFESQAPGWAWFFIGMYFFVGGVAAGAYFVSSLIELVGTRSQRQISRIGYYIAFPLLLITPLLLIADLGRPERFWYLFFYVNGGVPYINLQSPISVGSWALLVFGVVSLLSFVDNLVADGYLKFAPFRELYNRIPRKIYAFVGSAAGFFIAGYTGVLLNITVRPFWVATDPWIGALFIASAASTGAAAIYLVMAVRKILHQYELAEFERFDRYSMIFELLLIAIMLIAAGQFAQPLFTGGLAVLFWVGTVGLGLLVPLGLELYTRSQGRRLHHSVSLVIVVAVLVLLGGALLRISLVQAGQV